MEGECDWEEHGERKDFPREAVSTLQPMIHIAVSSSLQESIVLLRS